MPSRSKAFQILGKIRDRPLVPQDIRGEELRFFDARHEDVRMTCEIGVQRGGAALGRAHDKEIWNRHRLRCG